MIALAALSWFPQEYATEFFVFRGIVCLIATCAVIVHMARTWSRVTSLGQRLRYVGLLLLIANLAFASVSQVQDNALVGVRHLGTVVGAVVVVIAMAVSIHEDILRDRQP